MPEHQHPPQICDYEGSDYQQAFWEEGGRAYEDAAEKIALNRLLPSAGRLMLEIGAGAGRNTLRYTGYDHIVLLDYSVTQLQQARERLGDGPRFTYVTADVYRMPFVAGLFDGATMIRVLHHMADGLKALQQVHRVLEPNGVFILEFANKLNLKAIARYALRRQSWSPFAPEPVEFVALNYNFHPKTTRQWLRNTGFSVERQLTVSHFRIGLLKRLFPTRLLAAADGLASLTGNLWQLSPSVFVRCRADRSSPKADPGAFFMCPDCGAQNFQESPDEMLCKICSTSWPVRDGIYIFK